MKKLIIALCGIVLFGSIGVYAAVEIGSADKILTAKIVNSFQKTYQNLEARWVNCDNYVSVIEKFQKRIKLTLIKNKVERTKIIKEYSKKQITNYVEWILACNQEEDVTIEDEGGSISCRWEGQERKTTLSEWETQKECCDWLNVFSFTHKSYGICYDPQKWEPKCVVDGNKIKWRYYKNGNLLRKDEECMYAKKVNTNSIDRTISDWEKVPAKLAYLYVTKEYSNVSLDVLDLNPNFVPWVNDYFINENSKTREAVIINKTKFYKCWSKSTALWSVLVNDKDKKLTDWNVGWIYYFDIENGIVKTIYESCLP